MESISYLACFNDISPSDKESIINFWINQDLANNPDFNFEQRLKQIAFIAKSSDEVIGVSSYYLDTDEYLQAQFYYLRASVSKNYRQTGIAAELVEKMTNYLEKLSLKETLSSVSGAVIIYENSYLQKFFKKAVVESPTFYFYAFDKENCPRRVHYFKSSKIIN